MTGYGDFTVVLQGLMLARKGKGIGVETEVIGG